MKNLLFLAIFSLLTSTAFSTTILTCDIAYNVQERLVDKEIYTVKLIILDERNIVFQTKSLSNTDGFLTNKDCSGDILKTSNNGESFINCKNGLGVQTLIKHDNNSYGIELKLSNEYFKAKGKFDMTHLCKETDY